MILGIILTLLTFNAQAEEAFGRPGIIHNWSSAKKVQAGTSYEWDRKEKKSLVWFTNTHGILTETYYPTIDKAQIKDAQILVTDHRSFTVDEKNNTRHKAEVTHPALVKMTNTDFKNRFTISHTYFTMPDRSSLIDEITITSKVDGLHYYLLVNPAINNTGNHDIGTAHKESLEFREGNTKLIVEASPAFSTTSVGFVGFSDGYQDLYYDFEPSFNFKNATNGNVAGHGKIAIPPKKGTYKVYVAYHFNLTKNFLAVDYKAEKKKYVAGWDRYLKKLKRPQMENRYKKLYDRSIVTLKVHEDKLTDGAHIASLSKPWGDKLHEYPGVFTGGYHLVWPRDLYHVATALLYAGDKPAVVRALRFLESIQYQNGHWQFEGRKVSKKGAFPQNVWTNGVAYWGGFQIDQVGYPVHLFYQLYLKSNTAERKKLMKEFGGMVKAALDLIKRNGPWSAQERWEENFGISPSSFSVATAALMMGEKLFPGQNYRATAYPWLFKNNDNIHSWTFTNTGKYGDGQYYLRVAGCESHLATWNPNSTGECTIANSGQRINPRAILDQGFLKLALMGLVDASDWRLKTSLEKVNQNIRVKTPHGYGWYRYSYDAYGNNKRGKLWPLLSGEQARYQIERYADGDVTWEQADKMVKETLNSYLGFANTGMMLPEQVYEKTGEGTGAATPLAWSHAEYIKLIWSRENKHNIENIISFK